MSARLPGSKPPQKPKPRPCVECGGVRDCSSEFCAECRKHDGKITQPIVSSYDTASMLRGKQFSGRLLGKAIRRGDLTKSPEDFYAR